MQCVYTCVNVMHVCIQCLHVCMFVRTYLHMYVMYACKYAGDACMKCNVCNVCVYACMYVMHACA